MLFLWLPSARPDGDGTLDFPLVYALDDTRDPSRFAIVYETGDNATVVLGGEATLTDAEIDAAVQSVLARLAEQTGAKLRV